MPSSNQITRFTSSAEITCRTTMFLKITKAGSEASLSLLVGEYELVSRGEERIEQRHQYAPAIARVANLKCKTSRKKPKIERKKFLKNAKKICKISSRFTATQNETGSCFILALHHILQAARIVVSVLVCIAPFK